MFIIDFHTHCFPDAIAHKAVGYLAEKAGIKNWHDGTLAGLDGVERSAGCGGYVIQSIATNPKQTASVNRFAAASQDEKRHVYAFGSIHPDDTGYKEQLRDAKALGLKGIKLHPEYQEFHVNDPKMFPIYEEIFRQGFPLLFHAGEDLGFAPPWHGEPEKIAQIAERYQQATIIAAHMGGYGMWRRAAEVLAPHKNVLIDISFYAGRMPAEEFEEAYRIWGGERLLFGTDAPWSDIKPATHMVNSLSCPAEDKQLIFSGNALRVLGCSK